MRPNAENTSTLVQVARLYYEDELSQQTIADQLGVSRSLIALYLKKAREQGIVRIEVVNPLDIHTELGLTIQNAFKLRYVQVLPSASNPDLTRRALGGAVARALDEQLNDGNVLGLGWGRTIMEVTNLLAPARLRQIEVVPLLGESIYTGSYTQMNHIVLQAANSFGGKPFFLLAPLVVSSEEVKEALLSDSYSNEVIKRWERLDVACVGIGSLPASGGQVLYMGEEHSHYFLEHGAVGDICARYYDASGKPISSALDKRIIALPLEHLRRAASVIVAANGTEKTNAVIGALQSGLVTDLYIDSDLGQMIVQELKGKLADKELLSLK